MISNTSKSQEPMEPTTMKATPANPFDVKLLDDVESILGYRFQDRSRLVLALTHSSFAHESSGTYLACNERLEFLGDAVLGLVVTLHLYTSHPDYAEGKLSVIKSRLVSGDMLSKMAKSLHLGKYLLLGRGEEKLGGRARKSMLARMFEALVGAIFLDGGFEKAQAVILCHLRQEMEDGPRTMEQFDYKSQLQKITQHIYGTVPAYEIVSLTGPDHGRVFRVRAMVGDQFFAIARGTSKKTAQQRAARLVLKKIEKQNSK